jgi:cytochrome c biogenesis protein CcdA
MGIGSVAGAFIAGLLTTLSPCVLPILPIVLGELTWIGSHEPKAHLHERCRTLFRHHLSALQLRATRRNAD